MPASSALGCDRSRAGSGPISARRWTDLDAEWDRSRAGSGPISARRWTDLAAEVDRSRRMWQAWVAGGRDVSSQFPVRCQGCVLTRATCGLRMRPCASHSPRTIRN